MNPVFGSAITDKSGTMRIVCDAVAPVVFCQVGRDQTCETPPPPPPPLEFQTVWLRGLMLFTVSPPTLVT